MGKEVDYNVDHYFPDKPIRTTESIKEAKQKIDQPSNKLFYALFWFWENSNNTIDEMAFDELQNGNVEKAIEFWEKSIENGITAKNRSNHRNLATLKLGLSTHDGNLNKDTFLNSLSLSGEFLANGHFEEFTSQVLGDQYNVDLLETTSHYVDEIISIAKPHLDKKSGIKTNELINHFNDFPSNIQSDIMENFTGKYIHNIEKQIDSTNNNLDDNARVANKLGLELYKNTQVPIKQLQEVFTKSDLKLSYEVFPKKILTLSLYIILSWLNPISSSSRLVAMSVWTSCPSLSFKRIFSSPFK